MTTVAYKAPILASDSAINQNDVAIGNAQKIFKLKNGALVGFAGDLHESEELLDILKQTVSPSRVRLRRFKNVEAIVVRPDGTVWQIGCENGKASHVQIEAQYHAIGSGRDLALGALADGATAPRAIKAAAKHDMHTQLPIQELRWTKHVNGS